MDFAPAHLGRVGSRNDVVAALSDPAFRTGEQRPVLSNVNCGALIAGILLRFSFGMRHIRANYCRNGVKRLQKAGLLAMIAVLVLVETLLCLIPAAGFKGADLMFFSVVGLGYLLVMSCVLYPGRPK